MSTDRTGKKWRPYEIERLRSGLATGEAADEIGCDLERSAVAVRQRAYRLAIEEGASHGK